MYVIKKYQVLNNGALASIIVTILKTNKIINTKMAFMN